MRTKIIKKIFFDIYVQKIVIQFFQFNIILTFDERKKIFVHIFNYQIVRTK